MVDFAQKVGDMIDERVEAWKTELSDQRQIFLKAIDEAEARITTEVTTELDLHEKKFIKLTELVNDSTGEARTREVVIVRQLNTNTEVLNVIRLALPNVRRAIAKYFEKKRKADQAAQAAAQETQDLAMARAAGPPQLTVPSETETPAAPTSLAEDICNKVIPLFPEDDDNTLTLGTLDAQTEDTQAPRSGPDEHDASGGSAALPIPEGS